MVKIEIHIVNCKYNDFRVIAMTMYMCMCCSYFCRKVSLM
jgi:hypothetical protein